VIMIVIMVMPLLVVIMMISADESEKAGKN
jgi:hypothetical protein